LRNKDRSTSPPGRRCPSEGSAQPIAATSPPTHVPLCRVHATVGRPATSRSSPSVPPQAPSVGHRPSPAARRRSHSRTSGFFVRLRQIGEMPTVFLLTTAPASLRRQGPHYPVSQPPNVTRGRLKPRSSRNIMPITGRTMWSSLHMPGGSGGFMVTDLDYDHDAGSAPVGTTSIPATSPARWAPSRRRGRRRRHRPHRRQRE
jgi:hypothetical protein